MVTNDSGYHFEPHVAWVKPGGTVTWKLESGSHTTTAYHPKNDRPLRIPDGAASWDSGLLSEQGATFEHTFETEGVYDYYCAPHEAMGMLGSVIVGKPEAHGQPGLAAPQPSLPKTAQAKIKELNEMVNEALGHTHETEQTHDDHHKKSFGGWFEKTENYEGVHDKTGQEQVTVTVGAPDVAGGPMAFDPAAIRIDPGTDVVWQWTGAGSGHNVVDKTGGSKDVPMTDKDDAEFVSGKPVDKKGHTFSYTFEKPGTTHKYYCMPHNAEGMRGVIEVADSS
ncbi:MAG: halocyanin domain-containing protein [Halorientalis sp.]